MKGATLLRLTRQQVSPTAVIALGRADPVGRLVIDPLGSFAVTVATLVDPGIEGVLAAGGASPVEEAGRQPARGGQPPASPRSSPDDGRGTHPIAVRAPTMTAPAVWGARRRGRVRSRPFRPAAAPAPAPFVEAGAISSRPVAAPGGHAGHPDLESVPHPVAAPAIAAPTTSHRPGSTSWARRAAAVGGSTPVDIPTGPARTVAEVLKHGRPPDHGGNADGRRFTSSTPSGAGEFANRRTEPAAPAPAPVPAPVAPAMAGSDGRRTSRSQLAGLAHWWNEAHGPAEAPAEIAEAGAATIAAPTVEPHRATAATAASASSVAPPVPGAGDLRAVFGGLLEELLLTEARADGIEVGP